MEFSDQIDFNYLIQNNEIYEKTVQVVEYLISSGKRKFLDILKKIVLNICQFPKETKYHELKQSNKAINELTSIMQVVDFLLFINFHEILNENNEKCFLLLEVNLNLLNSVYNNLCLLEDDTDYFLNKNKNPEVININSNIVDNEEKYKSKFTLKPKAKELPKQKDIKDILKETAMLKGKNNSNSQNNIPSLSDKEFVNQYKNNLQSSNQPMSYQYDTSKSVYNTKSNDCIGLEALYFTNKFRKDNKLNAVDWEENIWKICYEHSENMGKGKVKFGHAGFNERINKLPFTYTYACENVYMCSNVDERLIGSYAVEGWINSPGHRKNLLSGTTYCAIATYKSGNTYYLTQIFIRK